MTPEARLDRLENIAKLFVRAGLRHRRDVRQLSEKIDMLVNAQIKNEEMFGRNEERFARNEERFAKNEERFAKNEERFAKNEERFAKNEERFARFEARVEALSIQTDRRFAELAESQANTDRRLNALIDLFKKGRNGNGLQTS